MSRDLTGTTAEPTYEPGEPMNFYASPEYLSLVAQTYFKGQRTAVEDVRVGSKVLRLLVVDEKRPISELCFLDYHDPLGAEEIRNPVRDFGIGYAPWVTHDVVDFGAWDASAFPGFEAAPFVDWSAFPTYADYVTAIKGRQKSLIKEHERRRRRLAEELGPITFAANDGGDDVFPLSFQWKSAQLRETGVNDYLAEPMNVEYLTRARESGVLSASTLRAGGRLLSAWLGFMHERIWSGWVFTYDHDPALKKYCLGHQLVRSMLEESHRLGHRQFDFSIGGEEYKWVYATHARVLGPSGRAPLATRFVSAAKQQAKRALAVAPLALEIAVALKKHV
jgi:hypothetical protein